jgi:HEAT repeat protein
VPEEVRKEVFAIFAAASPRAAERLVELLDSDDENVAHKASDTVLKKMFGDELLVKIAGQLDTKDVTDARDSLARKLSSLVAALAPGAGSKGSTPEGE